MADGDLPQISRPSKITQQESRQISHNLSTQKASYAAIVAGRTSVVESPQSTPTTAQESVSAQHIITEADFAELKHPILIQGTPAILFNDSEQSTLVSKFNYALIGKFSHGKPSWKKISEFFNSLKLKSSCNVSNFDQKHIYIVCSNKTDFNRIWLRLVWFIDGFAMRVFKWEPKFTALKESSIAPVWIRLEGLPLYMFDKMPLLNISNAIGKPICIDTRNLNGTMLNSAKVCVELDVSKPLIEAIQVGIVNQVSNALVEEIPVQVCYDFVPSFCHSCWHLGHSQDRCKRSTSPSDVIEQRPGKEIVESIAAPSSSNQDVVQIVDVLGTQMGCAVSQDQRTTTTAAASCSTQVGKTIWVPVKKSSTAIDNFGSLHKGLFIDEPVIELDVQDRVEPREGKQTVAHTSEQAIISNRLKPSSSKEWIQCKNNKNSTTQIANKTPAQQSHNCFEALSTLDSDVAGIINDSKDIAPDCTTDADRIGKALNSVCGSGSITTVCAVCPSHEVPSEAKSSETSAAREDNLAVVNIAENAESSKSTDLPSYKTVLQLEGANSIEVEPPLKASNQEQTTPIASMQQGYSELTKDAAIEVVSKIANKDTLAAKKLAQQIRSNTVTPIKTIAVAETQQHSQAVDIMVGATTVVTVAEQPQNGICSFPLPSHDQIALTAQVEVVDTRMAADNLAQASEENTHERMPKDSENVHQVHQDVAAELKECITPALQHRKQVVKQANSMEENTRNCSTYHSFKSTPALEIEEVTESRSTGYEDTSDQGWQLATRNKNKRPNKAQSQTSKAIVVWEGAAEAGETLTPKNAELQIAIVSYNSEDVHQTIAVSPSLSEADHQAIAFTPTRSTKAQADHTLQELTSTKDRQYIDQNISKAQGAVTRAQTKTTNKTWADQVEEEQLANLSRKQLDRKITKLASRLNNMGLKHALRGQLEAEMEVLHQHITQRFPRRYVGSKTCLASS